MTSTERLFRTTEEQVKPIEACVTGTIPACLNGSYIRVGPGIFDYKDFTVNHWCDGLGVVYKFEINNGQVLFSKRIIQSDAYKKMISVGRPVFTELGTKAFSDTNKNIFQKMVSNVIPELTDNVCANIFQLGETVLLSTETCNLRKLDHEDLSTDKKVDLSSYVPLNRLCSHLYKDSNGTGYTLGSSFTNNFKCQVIKIQPNNSPNNVCKKAQSICTIPNRLPKSSTYSHSFGLSDRFVVYIEQPFFVNNMRLMTAHLKGRSLLDCMDWDPSESTRFILVDKESGVSSQIIYESESPFFFLHVVNCYEEDNEVIVDVIAHDSPEVLESLYLEKLRNTIELKDQAAIRRFIIPLSDKIENFPEGQNLVKTDSRVSARREGDKIIIKGAILTEPNYDLPTINNKYFGKKYTYCYATGLFGKSIYYGCVLKVNVHTGEVITWNDGEGSIPGEATFVSKPECTSEDDGYLLVGVTATKQGKQDFLVVLDAKDLTEVARAEVNAHVPHLIHALFVPSKA